MLYYVTHDLVGSGDWAAAGRNWAKALQEVGATYRLLCANPTPTQPYMLYPEFTALFDLDGPMMTEPKQGTALILHGTALEASRWEEGNMPPVSVALIDWPTSRAPSRIVRGLSRFAQVWVPTAGAKLALVESGLRSRCEVVPYCHGPELYADRAERSADAPFSFLAIGSWEGLGNVKLAFDVFCSLFSGREDVRLCIVCPDAPIRTKADVPKGTQVSVLGAMPKRLDERRAIYRECDCFVASYLVHSPTWGEHESVCSGLAVAAPGVRQARQVPVDCQGGVIEEDQDALWPSEDGLRAAMLAAFDARHKPATVARPTTWSACGQRMVELLGVPGVFAMGGSYLDAQRSARGKLRIVVTHRDRGVWWLAATVASLRVQLGEEDEIVVVDQGSSSDMLEAVVSFSEAAGVTLVSDQAPPKTWNLARARNQGVRAPGGDPRWVMFFDCDTLLPPGYLDLAFSLLSGEPDAIVVPLVADFEAELHPEDLDPIPEKWPGEPKRVRHGSGLALMSGETFASARGFDEGFSGWGSEDVDFLFRMRATGRQARALEHGGIVYHQPHPPSPHREDAGKANMARLRDRMAGKLSGVNPDGWGDGGKVLVRRGERV